MSSPILVTGGTGTLGRLVVRDLLARGHRVRVLSRRAAGPDAAPPAGGEWVVGDLRSGAGLAEALAGVRTVAHCATGSRGDAEMGAQLLIAATRSERPHIVFHSAVGADAIRSSYYRDKRAMERLLEGGELPWTVVRTTDLHEYFAEQMRQAARWPVMRVPAETRFQPVAAAEVSVRIADLCCGIQAHHVPMIGGPEILSAFQIAQTWLTEAHKRRKVVPIRMPGAEHDGWRIGGHLAPDRMVGEQTFAAYLLAAREGRAAEQAARKAAEIAAEASSKQAERDARTAASAARTAQRADDKAQRADDKAQRAADKADRKQKRSGADIQPPVDPAPRPS